MRRLPWTRLSAAGILVVVIASVASAQSPDGAALYQRRCASCHDNPTERTPPRQALQAMTSARILRVMDFGAMMTVAYTLTRAEREVTALVLEGHTNEQIAKARGTAPSTVANQLQAIFEKLGVNGRLELVAHCVERSLFRSRLDGSAANSR
jgi:DNA-binding CsgD family transcriptional regulator